MQFLSCQLVRGQALSSDGANAELGSNGVCGRGCGDEPVADRFRKQAVPRERS